MLLLSLTDYYTDLSKYAKYSSDSVHGYLFPSILSFNDDTVVIISASWLITKLVKYRVN